MYTELAAAVGAVSSRALPTTRSNWVGPRSRISMAMADRRGTASAVRAGSARVARSVGWLSLEVQRISTSRRPRLIPTVAAGSAQRHGVSPVDGPVRMATPSSGERRRCRCRPVAPGPVRPDPHDSRSHCVDHPKPIQGQGVVNRTRGDQKDDHRRHEGDLQDVVLLRR